MSTIGFVEPDWFFKKSLLSGGVNHWSKAKEHVDENMTIYGEIANSKKVTLIRAADITANWIYCAERDSSKYPPAIGRIEKRAVLYRHP